MAGTLTPLGKELRKLRIDKEEALKDMAAKLGYTSSYLSGIETGKHIAPQNLVLRLKDAYKPTKEELARVYAAYTKTIIHIGIDLEGTTDLQRNVAVLFAHLFRTLKEEELQGLWEILSERLNKPKEET